MLKKVVVVLGLLGGSILAAWGASSALSGLSAGGPITNTDLFYDVQTVGVGGVKVTGAQFLNYVFANVSGSCTASNSGVFSCAGSNVSTNSIAAGTNIVTSGTVTNTTVSVIATPTFTSITTTLASVSGWLTAPGVNMQTASIAGNLTAAQGSVTGWLTASGVNVNTLTLAGSIVVKVRSSSSAAVTASATTDYFLCLDSTSTTITVGLPASPATGLTYLIKDCTGQAATHNIILSPTTGNIDNAANYFLTAAFQSVGATYTGSQWSVN